MRPREKSSSITQLVKIVAREVVEEFFEEKGLDSLADLGDKWAEKLRSDLEMAGRPWSGEESALLKVQVRTAIAQIAKNHRRSMNAIRMRIEEQDLLDVCR